MAADIRQRGRPRGDKRAALRTWMQEHSSFTMSDLSRSLGWSLTTANNVLQRAKTAGEVEISGSRPCEGMKRPALVFAAPAERACGDLHRVMQLWSPGRTG